MRQGLIEIRCHACTASQVLTPGGFDDLATQAAKRGWRIDRGVIACKAHQHVTVMPRHRTHRY